MEESVERISQKYRHPCVEIQEFNWIELLLATELILQTFRSFLRLPNQIWLIELALFPYCATCGLSVSAEAYCVALRCMVSTCVHQTMNCWIYNFTIGGIRSERIPQVVKLETTLVCRSSPPASPTRFLKQFLRFINTRNVAYQC